MNSCSDQKRYHLQSEYHPRLVIFVFLLLFYISSCEQSRDGLVARTQVRQIAYYHGVKTRLSKLGTVDVPRGSDSVKQ